MTRLATLVERLLARELDSVRRELEAYPDESLIWALPQGLPNSAGTLALHLAGNLRHFVGACLGNTGYVRDRPAEFTRRDVPRAELLAGLSAAADEIRATLPTLDDEALARPFPVPLRAEILATDAVLAHLAAHLAYHLGQISYHRRVVTGDAGGVGAVDPDALVATNVPG